MNPLGFALEAFDAVGRFRTEDDHGIPIDSTGDIQWAYAETSAYFDDAVGMAEALATEPAALDCFVSTLFHYAYGREAQPGDEVELYRLQDHFREHDGDIRELILELVSAPHFVNRDRSQR